MSSDIRLDEKNLEKLGPKYMIASKLAERVTKITISDSWLCHARLLLDNGDIEIYLIQRKKDYRYFQQRERIIVEDDMLEKFLANNPIFIEEPEYPYSITISQSSPSADDGESKKAERKREIKTSKSKKINNIEGGE